MRILVFDNYDSFTYNLVHLVEKILQERVEVYRNDQIPLKKVNEYDKIILSPGPGVPEEAGLLLPLIKEYGSSKSILGVCLGLQAIGQAFGGKLENLSTVYHGVATPVKVVNGQWPVANEEKNASRKICYSTSSLFEGLPETFPAGRYHSWIVSKENFPAELE
ncbi:MAG TPA: aminodeoxychorismate/anthranilate synthase component II, partial [Parafilimonas sp.]|nr:aminodeoxychorismate/anthranilate synthase component II [Parafilimonas sp.]